MRYITEMNARHHAYTVNQESSHLLIQGIPAVGLEEELRAECEKFGPVEAFELIRNYPVTEKFTDVFYLKYGNLREARYAKKKLDNRCFFGGLIHICYAPELETVAECGDKLFQRKQYVQNYNTKTQRGGVTVIPPSRNVSVPAPPTNAPDIPPSHSQPGRQQWTWSSSPMLWPTSVRISQSKP